MKRTRRQSHPSEEASVDLAASPSASPDRKRTRTGGNGGAGDDMPVDEADVRSIVNALRQKPEWQRKVADPTIAAKWRAEAVAQGASQRSVVEALGRLLRESVVGSAGGDSAATVGCTLTVPSKEERDAMADRDDRDLYLEYDERFEGTRNDVFWRDDLVPDELRAALEAKLDAIAAGPEKDFHPGSDGKVQDLIHPSLYPYVRGLSYERNAASAPPEVKTKIADVLPVFETDYEEGASRDDEDEDEDGDKEKDEDEVDYEEMGGDEHKEKHYLKKERLLEQVESIYQWLPAEFVVDGDGAVSIDSYINNLDRKQHAALYDDIAGVFRLFVPLFEMVLQQESLRNRRLQVIVKAANYILQPGQTHEGSWHVEGMQHERIAASGIYYYHTTPNLAGSYLCFREKRDNDMEERGSTQGFSFVKNLGKTDTPMGRCLAFANHLQHKVKGMQNDSKEVGLRKILCFFLVNPNDKVKSSADIPEQQWDKTKRDVAKVLVAAMVQHRVLLPREIILHILDLAKWGFSLEEAKKHREQLMWERKFVVSATNEIWEREYSFCEH